MPVLAITGATGFVGGHLLAAATAAGHTVRALARRPQPGRPGTTWIPGDLADTQALTSLLTGADAVIHVAGVTNARTAQEFHAGNAEATARLAALAAPLPFVHVSSLAAREPRLSTYGASKAAAEATLTAYAGRHAIVRPGAVYGPHDTDLLGLFTAAAQTGLAPFPAGQRAAFIHAEDLAAALLALTGDLTGPATAHARTLDLDDGAGSHDAIAIAAALTPALGRPVRPVPVPAAVLRIGARLDTLRSRFTGRLPTLSRDRAAYLAHPDWSADPEPMRRLGIWSPRLGLPAGFAQTAAWYRAQGLLPRIA